MAGVSDNENKEWAKNWIDALNPNNVLDIGAGRGTYSILARQDNQHWTALEVFYPYVNEYELWQHYDSIFIGDARFMDYSKMLADCKIEKWDLIIAADMLEHMNKWQAEALITELLQHCERLLICFPVEHQEQHAGDEGNDFETHVDHWHYEEMKAFLAESDCAFMDSIKGDVLAYFLVTGNI